MRGPDLDHHQRAWCSDCDRMVDARQVFRHRTKAWPMLEWGKLGKQYDYRCVHCHAVARIAYTPASTVIDWSNLGTRIGDRTKPLADSTLGRIQRYLDANQGRLPAVRQRRHGEPPATERRRHGESPATEPRRVTGDDTPSRQRRSHDESPATKRPPVTGDGATTSHRRRSVDCGADMAISAWMLRLSGYLDTAIAGR